MRQILTALLLTFINCGTVPPPTIPTPTPTPTVEPHVLGLDEPLMVSNQKFTYKGEPINLLGSIICCSDGVVERGFPLITDIGLEEIAQAKGNYTHIRLGPFRGEADPGNEAILADGSWNPVFWSRVDHLLETARIKGIFVEVDVIDGWAAKTGQLWWGYRCDMMSRPPDEAQVTFIRKVVEVAGKYPNTLWQLSNESGVEPCGRHLTPAWELGIAREIIAAEQQLNYKHHLIGTNAGNRHPEIQNAAEIDYLNFHTETPLIQEGPRPMVVNEWGGEMTPDEWASLARQARSQGTIFHMWRAETWSEIDNRRALDLLKEIQSAS